jgi:hypothetical protein
MESEPNVFTVGVLVQMIDPIGVKAGSPTFYPVDLVALG